MCIPWTGVVQTSCISSLLEETEVSSSSSFFHWQSPSPVHPLQLCRQQQERNSSGCCVIQPEPESSHCSPGKLLARYRRAIYISELCTCFIAGDTKEYIWGVLMWSCSLFSKFLHLISVWDLGKVETGLWGHRKRSPSWGRISWLYGTVYATCTWQSIL